MLVLTVLLTLAVLIQNSATINLTYILKKNGDYLYPSCMAEEDTRYSGIGWIFPFPDTPEMLPKISTKFVPDISNDFNCQFKKQGKCNNIWAIKNWQIDTTSTRNFNLILDNRWEDFPIIYTNSKIGFKERVEVPHEFKIGFSVRANASIELFICEGWNPSNYPCYQIEIGQSDITLRKFTSVPEKITKVDKILDSYKAFSNILSHDEWRNFIIEYDNKGQLILVDVSVNRTVLQFDDTKQQLKPLYLLFRSTEPALWKVHQNHFMYTTTPQISRLGPTLNIAAKELCVSLYVLTCPNCSMNFILMKGNNERKILKEVEPTDSYKWQLIKLKDENLMVEKINIFVETKFIGGINEENDKGFWAIDDVRVCHENEVKVSFLTFPDKITEDDELITCQVVEHPKWRPKKLIYSNIKELGNVEYVQEAKAINLTWPQEDPHNNINYFVTYSANDLCLSEPFNLQRRKSNGFAITKHNDLRIDSLIPYTNYNVSLSSTLHEKEIKLFITTLETVSPTPVELPNGIKIQVTDTVAYVSWDKVDCSKIYGHILYGVNVTNLVTNTTTSLKIQTENVVQITDLEPFTPYLFNIVTARSYENIQNNVNVLALQMNFITKPGTAGVVYNLEVYATDENSISLRYDLPLNSRGVPKLMQVKRCNPLLFKKCKTVTLPVEKCVLWPQKYCLDINNLVAFQNHSLYISLRNDQTNYFGNETKISAYTNETVPGIPMNVTYKFVDCKHLLDYCHLNVSWIHPYDQQSDITAFHLVLNSTNSNIADDTDSILKINNKTYSLSYEYQIKFIPYSARYDFSVQSVNNKYKSAFTTIPIKTDDLGDHIDQKPKLIETEQTSVKFQIPNVDSRLDSYSLTVIVQDFNQSEPVPKDLDENFLVMDNLCHYFGKTWIMLDNEPITNETSHFINVGSGQGNDLKLKPQTQYCITFIISNKYKGSEHYVAYYEKFETDKVRDKEEVETGGSANYLWILLLILLLLVPVAYLLYRRFVRGKRPQMKSQQNAENVYESLPFEECDNNFVSNETYDQLLHK